MYSGNWHVEILKVMFGITSSASRLLAYGIFISRVIDHLEIDTSEMDFTSTNTREHLVGEHLIHKMSIYWYNGQYMCQEDYRTTMDIDLSDEENNADLPKQNPDPPQVEASQVPQVPSFGLAHLDAMEQRLNEQIDAKFQSLNEMIDSGLMSLYDRDATGV
ncbi:hypothetical protein Lal_00031887 [Lupinus albus]|nr:hypothetical protein Lal_00031887 [Lupinus albus]